jgi:hypothetical protein
MAQPQPNCTATGQDIVPCEKTSSSRYVINISENSPIVAQYHSRKSATESLTLNAYIYDSSHVCERLALGHDTRREKEKTLLEAMENLEATIGK